MWSQRKYTKRWQALVYFTLILILLSLRKLVFMKNFESQEEINWIINNRNVTQYLEKSQYRGQELECSKEQKIVVGVVSSPSNVLERNAIRRSWGSNTSSKWRIIFFMGVPQDQILKKEINQEMKEHGDIVETHFIDSYKNLTLKVLLLLKWVNQYCPNTNFFLKVDDDVYLNKEKMQTLLSCLNTTMLNMYSTKNSGECNEWDIKSIIGHYLTTNNEYKSYVAGGFLYKNINPVRDKNSKWFLDNNLYPYDVIPSSLSGTSYLLSTNLLPEILNQSKYHPIINLEDVYISSIILDKSLNVKLSHIKGWNNFRPQWDDPCLYKKILTSHGLSPTELVAINDKVNNLNVKNCEGLSKLMVKINEGISYYIPRIKY